MKNGIVLPNVDSARIVPASVTDCSSVTVTSHRNVMVNRCGFCFECYAYRNPRSRFCSDTCKQDAYQVRKAFSDGYAVRYYHEMDTRL